MLLLSRARPALRNVARQQRMLSAAPQPVWAPTVRQHAWFRFRVVEANRTAT